MNQHDALPNDALPSSHGYFLDGGREFAVTEPNTPRGWMNYAWNPRFISAVNQHGGGDGAYKERAIQYIDPRGRALVVRDAQRCFYLRDRGSGVLWSPGWHPVQRTLDQYRCRHRWLRRFDRYVDGGQPDRTGCRRSFRDNHQFDWIPGSRQRSDRFFEAIRSSTAGPSADPR